MTIEKEIERGIHADQLLDHYLYKEAIATVKSTITDQWSSSPIRDKEGAHELRLMLHCLNAIEQHIKTVAETGKMAKIQRETLAQRMIRMVA